MSDIWRAIPHRLTTVVDRAIKWSNGEWSYVTDLVTNGSLASLNWFDRDSTATYIDADGVEQTAAIDEPRTAYDPDTHALLGLMIDAANGTQAAESATVSPIDDWWNGTAFTVLVDGIASADETAGAYEYFFAAHDGTLSNLVAIRRESVSGEINVHVVQAGRVVFSYNLGRVVDGSGFLAALSGGDDGYSAYLDNSIVYTGASGAGGIPAVNEVNIGHLQGGQQANGYIRSVSLYPVHRSSALPGRPGYQAPVVLTPDDGDMVARDDLPMQVGLHAASYAAFPFLEGTAHLDADASVSVGMVDSFYIQRVYDTSDRQETADVGVALVGGTLYAVVVQPEAPSDDASMTVSLAGGRLYQVIVQADPISDDASVNVALIDAALTAVVVQGDAVADDAAMSVALVGGAYTQVVT